MSYVAHRAPPVAFSHHDCHRLANLLALFAEEASVRELEAMAAVHANSRHLSPGGGDVTPPADTDDACWSRETPKPAGCRETDTLGDPLFAMCHRIARRACTGALPDPTGGATRFHSIVEFPAWAVGRSPSAWIGEFLFYR